jgi:hypothetical protein
MTEEKSINPKIVDDMVIQIKVGNIELPLKKEIPLTEFSGEFINSLNYIASFIDFNKLQSQIGTKLLEEWDENSIQELLMNSTIEQLIIVQIIIYYKMINSEKIIKIISKYFNKTFTAKQLGGIVAGLKRRSRKIAQPNFIIISKEKDYSIPNKYFDKLNKVINIINSCRNFNVNKLKNLLVSKKII